jgi:hypothetical protein
MQTKNPPRGFAAPTPAGERSVPAARFAASASELKNPEQAPGFSNYQP